MTSGCTVPLSWEISEARAQKKRGKKRTPKGLSTSAQISTVLSSPFFSPPRQMRSGGTNVCHILRTYAGSSHTDNQRTPRGQVTLAVLRVS